ncbi:hydroxymethylglutaryl-CoA lyase [Sphingoaurantiacus capsulatus]|uniref:Hydroxymethylglutaryl-CoA lyase n=1 Tax=Sphingoaurantiacus capsulatus TaxID=1771310 RepID=A0ABV7XA11_9SPHN
MDRAVEILEVGPRDGLQNEPEVVSTEAKLGMIGRMIDAGVRRLEVASFVNPARVPQMGDAEAVIAGLPDRADVSYIGLCLNKRGVLRAIESREGNKRGVDEAGCVIIGTDSFGVRNQNQTVAQGIVENTDMLRLAREAGLKPQVTISVAFGCPFEGHVPPDRIVMMAEKMAEAGAVEIALADTIGVAVPAQVSDLFGRVREAIGPDIALRAHFHDTRGMGPANAWAAYQAGVATLDSSLGGLGGCPFAPGATGNVATEELLFLFARSGLETGVDIEAAFEANKWFAGILGRPLSSKVAKAGNFPHPA